MESSSVINQSPFAATLQSLPESLPNKNPHSTMAGDLCNNCSIGKQYRIPVLRAYQVVVAATRKRGIGKNGILPWKLPSDMKFFKEITTSTVDPAKRNAIIMGRKTWESIPLGNRPLRDRLNVVLSSSGSAFNFVSDNVLKCGSMAAALQLLSDSPYSSTIENVFVIGGGQVFSEFLNASGCVAIHITEIDTDFECDTFMPAIDKRFYQPWCSSFPVAENKSRFSFTTYVRALNLNDDSIDTSSSVKVHDKDRVKEFSYLPGKVFQRHEENLYLDLVRDIISTGVLKDDRTGTGTLSKFGCQMRFNLRRTFPLLTTKKVFWKGVVEELLWFISGSTNAKILQKKGVHIWDGNASRGYLDSIGLTEREEGDLGPIYGFQWRHFGARYTDMHADYTGQGVDQLSDLISRIKSNPNDRRLLLSAWNPSDFDQMALPPCHIFSQFYVADGELSCQMYQRSADMGLGVPFNIASYSLLTRMIAHVCDMEPGDFIHVIGDAHVYRTHIAPLQEQLKNTPRPFPTLKINGEKKEIDSFVAADFELDGYHPHPRIEMKMAL